MQVVKGDWKFTLKEIPQFSDREFAVYEEEFAQVSEIDIRRLLEYAQKIQCMDDSAWSTVTTYVQFNGKVIGNYGLTNPYFAGVVWRDYILEAYRMQEEDIEENERENLRILYGGRR